MSDSPRPAVVLLSGGLDSATALAAARNDGFGCHALTIAYGQRHAAELDAARRVAAALGAVQHRVFPIDLRARNTVFLSLALAWAETLGAFDLYIGVNAVDYSGYPDCRPEFVRAFEQLANLATKAGVEGKGRFRIHAPLIHLSKAEIIRLGLALGVDYGLTHSCYDPAADGAACGRCDSCRIRRDGFSAAAVPDPTRYAG
jgi:7-cyano-7-deazaguanine synthase